MTETKKKPNLFLCIILGIFIIASVFFLLYHTPGYDRVTSYEKLYDYAEQTTDKDGRIIKEMYFSANGEPVCLNDGNYGYAYEYDEQGRKILFTCLDIDGNPMMNVAGYASKSQVFLDDGSTIEWYYDTERDPIALSKGQYGVHYIGDRAVYLDQNGKEIFIWEYFLSENSWIVVIGVLIFCILLVLAPRKFRWILFVCSVLMVLLMTVMSRGSIGAQAKMQLFWSYIQFFFDDFLRKEIINNIWLFVPFGASLYALWQKKWVIFIPILFSVCLECTQLILGIGLFEFDDMLSNSLGGLAGVLMVQEMLKIRHFSR